MRLYAWLLPHQQRGRCLVNARITNLGCVQGVGNSGPTVAAAAVDLSYAGRGVEVSSHFVESRDTWPNT